MKKLSTNQKFYLNSKNTGSQLRSTSLPRFRLKKPDSAQYEDNSENFKNNSYVKLLKNPKYMIRRENSTLHFIEKEKSKYAEEES